MHLLNKTLSYHRLLTIISLSLLLYGCGQTREEKLRTKSSEELINTAQEELASGQYKNTIEYYDILQARHPQGTLAEEIALKKIYAYYKDRKPDEALQQAENFIRSYPRHPNVDYAWYMKGMIDFNRALSIFDKLLPPDRSKLDPYQMKRSLKAFETLVKDFPHSPYADDALQRTIYLRNTLAKSEMNIAQYYFRRKAYIATINRSQIVLDSYDRTPELSNALYLQVKSYRALKLNQLAEDRLTIFRLNYPNDERLKEFL